MTARKGSLVNVAKLVKDHAKEWALVRAQQQCTLVWLPLSVIDRNDTALKEAAWGLLTERCEATAYHRPVTKDNTALDTP